MAAVLVKRCATSTGMGRNLELPAWQKLSPGFWLHAVTRITRAGVSFVRWSWTRPLMRRGRSAHAELFPWWHRIC
jgi:hypothetical protein